GKRKDKHTSRWIKPPACGCVLYGSAGTPAYQRDQQQAPDDQLTRHYNPPFQMMNTTGKSTYAPTATQPASRIATEASSKGLRILSSLIPLTCFVCDARHTQLLTLAHAARDIALLVLLTALTDVAMSHCYLR